MLSFSLSLYKLCSLDFIKSYNFEDKSFSYQFAKKIDMDI